MEAIYIPQLAKAPEQTERIPVNEYLSGLETLTPVQGEVKVTHQGNYLEVSGTAETIVTLSCDRCLQQYNARLAVDTSELIWLQEQVDDFAEDGAEREVALDDLVETLHPQGHFQPGDWLYEQLCLAIPQRQLCDQACQGIQVNQQQPASQPTVDRRWASLENLRNHLPN
ncbi:MAG: DUF177 domain-containing protein [Elainellaceae cyanobacterium]